MADIPNSKLIPLTQGKFAIVDDGDYEFLIQWKWKYSNHGYAVRNHHIGMVDGKRIQKRIYMHRLIIGALSGQYTDHINGEVLDNRRCNLRICTNQQNAANSKKWSIATSSKYKGVSWDKVNKKWTAQIGGEERKHLGRFSSEIEAAKAYNKAALERHGEFAMLNILENSQCA